MQPFEARIEEWRAVYDQLHEARARRLKAFDGAATSAQIDALDAEITRLQQAHDAALKALYEEMRQRRES